MSILATTLLLKGLEGEKEKAVRKEKLKLKEKAESEGIQNILAPLMVHLVFELKNCKTIRFIVISL